MAGVFKSLGHPIRLKIYKRLLEAGRAGLTVRELRQGIDVCGSTLSQHITRMTASGLIHQQREGKSIRCSVVKDTLYKAIASLE